MYSMASGLYARHIPIEFDMPTRKCEALAQLFLIALEDIKYLNGLHHGKLRIAQVSLYFDNDNCSTSGSNLIYSSRVKRAVRCFPYRA